MQIERVDSNISFGYSSKLKTYWKQGKFPTVKYGFYGDRLTKKNVSIEHLQPKSKGGKSTLSNYVLASIENNLNRGNDDLALHFNRAAAERYLLQFLGIKVKGFDGNAYVKMILATIVRLLSKE